MIKVKDVAGNEVKGVARDRNGAIVSVDRAEYDAYQAKKLKAQTQESRLQALETGLSDIKSLLLELLNKQ